MQQRSRHLRRTAAGLASIVGGAVILVGGLSGQAGATLGQTTPSTSVVEGNPTCADLGDFAFEFKIDAQPEEGMTYDDPNSDFEVTITEVVDGDPMTFSFESNIAVSAVFVKAGEGGILYTFDPPSTSGTGLASPRDSISHVSFCWDEDHGTTTTTEKPTTTTTEHGTTTTTEKPTTTTTEHGTTTTTEQGTTSTTAGQGGTTTTAPGVGPTTPTTQPAGALPKTGSTTWPLVALGAGLLAGGVALVAGTRRLRQS
jgi:LPXTG-motif cell wall-anchored protein